MRYRIEYELLFGSNVSSCDSKKFEAENDKEAIFRVKDLCREAETEINATPLGKKRFRYFRVRFFRLVKINPAESGEKVLKGGLK